MVRDLVSPRHYSPSLFIGAPRHAEAAITNLEARPSRAKSLAESRPLSLLSHSSNAFREEASEYDLVDHRCIQGGQNNSKQ